VQYEKGFFAARAAVADVQQGPDIRDFLNMMGNRVGRATLFGVPLQQEWLYGVDGDGAPTYYLHSDAPLYTLRMWSAAYMSAGLKPVIMFKTFPGVFTGIGEFTIHKEFVSAKIPGEVASLQNPALDRILDFVAEVGLVILHNDINVPITRGESEPAYLNQISRRKQAERSK
jgi:hypothetical protein